MEGTQITICKESSACFANTFFNRLLAGGVRAPPYVKTLDRLHNYKNSTNGTRDCRYFAGLYLVFRIVLLLAIFGGSNGVFSMYNEKYPLYAWWLQHYFFSFVLTRTTFGLMFGTLLRFLSLLLHYSVICDMLPLFPFNFWVCLLLYL